MGDRSLRDAPPAGAPAGIRPLDAVADLVELVGGEGERSRRFLGGLVAGALVGAAIVGTAGAAIMRRREASAGTSAPEGVRTRPGQGG